MGNSEEILNELKELSPLLAGMDRTHPFTVPAGYFDRLDAAIIGRVLATVPPGTGRANIQSLPEGYFEGLGDSIMARIRAIYPNDFTQEGENIPALLEPLRKINPFRVPGDYFDRLPQVLLARITPQEGTAVQDPEHSPLLASLKDRRVFSVPADYFDTLPDRLLDRVARADVESAREELARIAPALAGIREEKIWTVPYGYFSSLAGDILEKVKPAPARLVRMHPVRSWLRVAVAAAVIIVVVLGSVVLLRSHGSQQPLAGDFSKVIQESRQYKTETDIDNAIASLDESDIAKYLEKNGGIVDNELLLNSTDESDLPDPNDYLIDDNTLNEYLSKIDANTNKLTP